MFTFGWSEIFLIGIIVVVVIGPKDLPKFIKQVGSFTKYIKKMSSEFKSSINEIAEEEEIKELAKSVKEVKKIKDGINIKKILKMRLKKFKKQ
jgi:sec-independent protein translocase protein TatB